jgi:quercetin dioxygenase-like cupin family protein
MTITQIERELENAKHPVARALHKGEHSRVLAIGFKKGMILKAHEAHLPSRLLVLEGSVLYREGVRETILKAKDDIEVPMAVIHDVTALENSLCILMQG